MSRMEKLRDFLLAEKVGRESMLSVSATDDLIKTGIVDSLTLMKIVSFMEEHFDIRVRDEDISARNFRTLAAMDAFIEYKRSET